MSDSAANRRQYLAENLRAIGRALDLADQRDVLPEEDIAEALQALVNVNHVCNVLAREGKL